MITLRRGAASGAEIQPDPTHRRRAQYGLGSLAALAVALAAVSPGTVRIAGAVAVVACAVPLFLGGRTILPTRVPMALAVGLVAVAGGGLAVEDRGAWQFAVVVLAYPLLARVLVAEVARYRTIRRADLVVEAGLIGAAGAIVLQAGIDWQVAEGAERLVLSRGGAPALLVGLDLALLVVAGWGLRVDSARRGPLAVLSGALVALFAAHLLLAFELSIAAELGFGAPVLVGLAVVLLGAGTLHATYGPPVPHATTEAPSFSVSHATVVVVSLLAAPGVLAVHTIRGISVSGTIAVGAVVSGLMLANYLVALLRERARVEHRATHDALTDLPNRHLFLDRLDRAIAHASRHQKPVGVLFLDLDGFKDVNDTLGHHAGDQLLQATAGRLLDSTRDEDTVARLGGDEFAVLLPHLRSTDDVLLVAQRLVDNLAEPTALAGHQVRTPASIGVAVYPGDGDMPADLLAAADAAMYRAKEHRNGGGFEVFSASLRSEVAELVESETALYEAIRTDQLILHFQPIFDSASGQVVGAEALVRWQHPDKGLLYPGAFIPMAERSDLIVLVGSWVIDAACRQLVAWQAAGQRLPYVAVNVSPRHFRHDVVSTVTSALRTNGVEPSRLVVEITESATADDLGTVSRLLGELRDLGVDASLDDFGTGYSSLQYLSDLPVATLKVDKSFVQSMTPRSGEIVAATIAMAHGLGLSVVAEGVETEEQLEFLVDHGCDRLQGFLLGRPVPADEFADRFLGPGRLPERVVDPVAVAG